MSVSERDDLEKKRGYGDRCSVHGWRTSEEGASYAKVHLGRDEQQRLVFHHDPER